MRLCLGKGKDSRGLRHTQLSSRLSFPPEQSLYLSHEILGKKGLFQKSAALRQGREVLDHLLGVTRHEEEFYIRAEGFRLAFKLDAVHVRHHDVAYHEMDRTRLLPKNLYGFCAISCRIHLVPSPLQRKAKQPSKRRLVLHNQDRLPHTPLCRGLWRDMD